MASAAAPAKASVSMPSFHAKNDTGSLSFLGVTGRRHHGDSRKNEGVSDSTDDCEALPTAVTHHCYRQHGRFGSRRQARAW